MEGVAELPLSLRLVTCCRAVAAIQNKKPASREHRRLYHVCPMSRITVTPLCVLSRASALEIQRCAKCRELQAAAYSGRADEELMSRRIAEQEAELERLTK
jgi:hypothetical protein